MKQLKLLFKLLILFISISCISLIGLLIYIDPNDYKANIIAIVKEKTGRNLEIKDEIKWSFWPRFGLTIGRTELSNTGDFGDTVFIAIDRADIGVQVRPLLTRKIAIDTVQLDGITVNLEIARDGKTNWQDLTTATDNSATTQYTAKDNTQWPDITIDGLKISNLKLSYIDHSTETSAQLDKLNFHTGPIALQTPIQFNGDLQMQSQTADISANAMYSGQLTVDPVNSLLTLDQLKLKLDSLSSLFARGTIKLQLDTDAVFDIANETIQLNALTAKIDDTTLTATAQVSNFAQPVIRFKTDIDKINADHYLPTTEAQPAAPDTASSTDSATLDDPEITLPTDTLRNLDVQGEISVGQLHIKGMKLTDLKTTLEAKRGIVILAPMHLSLYSGTLKANAELNVKQPTPTYRFAAKLQNLATGDLLKDTIDVDLMTGQGTFDIAVNTRGERLSTLKRGLNGQVDLSIVNGSIDADIKRNLQRLLKFLGKTQQVDPSDDKHKTIFRSLTASIKITDGIAKTKDFNMRSGDLQITGVGSFDIATDYLNFVPIISIDPIQCPIPFKGLLSELDYAESAKKALPNCIKDIAKSNINIQKEALKSEIESEQEKLKLKLKQKQDEEKQRLKEKQDAIERQLKQKLREKLGF